MKPTIAKRDIRSAKNAVITITSRWVSSKLAAELFGVAERTLSEWKNEGLILFSKPNGKTGTIFYDVESINRFIARHSVIKS